MLKKTTQAYFSLSAWDFEIEIKIWKKLNFINVYKIYSLKYFEFKKYKN